MRHWHWVFTFTVLGLKVVNYWKWVVKRREEIEGNKNYIVRSVRIL